MRKKTILMLTLLLTFSLFSVIPASAKKDDIYIAGGRLEGYVDAWSSEIVRGFWFVIEGSLTTTM